ncbi:glycosyl transferase [Spirochaetia bacterium]|nr:glycosyl transferase [Spirochaetia bacterium]
MNITIDCRMIDSSGVGVYLRECLPFLIDSDNTFTLLGETEKLPSSIRERQNIQILSCPVKPFSMRELFVFPRSLQQKINQTDLFYSPYFNIPAGITVPVYTTIHDIIFPDMPELTSKTGLMARMWFYRRAARLSTKIFTVSQFSKSRIEHFLCTKTPVIVTYNGVQAGILDSNSLTDKKQDHILFIGNIKKHKGLGVLLEAFLQARKEGLRHTLIIVGTKDNFRSQDSEILKYLYTIDSSGVEFTGFIPTEKLKVLLAEAALLVQPSLYEGFGYPPLEAMTLGTKTLISDIPVFREIYDEFPVTFFRAGDSKDLKEKLISLLYNREPERIVLSEQLREKYSFKKTANSILEELTGH